MKIRRLQVGAVVLSLFAVVLSGLLVVGGNARRAAFAPTCRSLRSRASERATGKRQVSGQARVSSELVLDTSRTRPPHPPSVILIIDLSGVSGTGSVERGKVIPSGAMEPPCSDSSPAPIRSRSLSRSLGHEHERVLRRACPR